MDCSGGSTCAGGRWQRGLDGEGVPVVEGGREGAGELRGVEAKLDVGSIWAERLWRRGSTAGLRLAGVRWSGGGVPGCLGRERARGRGKRNEESFLEPRRARGKGEIGVLSWAIHGGVRGGGRLDSSGRRGEGRGHQRAATGGGEGWERRVGASAKQEVAGWPSTVPATALHSCGKKQSRGAGWRKGKRT